MTLEKLVDTPDHLIRAIRHILELESVAVLYSIRRELLLSSVGHVPLNGRVEEFLTALTNDKESIQRAAADSR
jgi:hypothetical protein